MNPLVSQDGTKILIDREKLMALNAEGCAACGKKFTLGEIAVIACGHWDGPKYIHENEAAWDEDRCSYVAKPG